MDNQETIVYTLPSGAEIEIETLPEPRRGPQEVSAGKVAEKIPFDKVIKPLGEVSQLLFETIESSVRTPDSVTLEFAASLKGGTRLIVVGGEGKGSIKVRLTWNKAG